MITKDKECKLVKIYLFICDAFQEELKYYAERFTNNNTPEFTDEEVITIYLYVMQHEQQFKIKQIHRFAKELTDKGYNSTKGFYYLWIEITRFSF